MFSNIKGKSLLSILLVILLVFSMAACGSEKNESDGEKTSATGEAITEAAIDGKDGKDADSKSEGEADDEKGSESAEGSGQNTGSGQNSSTSASNSGGGQSSGTTIKCTISVSCSTVLNNMGELNSAKKGYVPSSGVILSKREVTVNAGATVFDVLAKATKSAGIQMGYNKSTGYAYVEGINNLYEFDCGSTSGWKYRVNGAFPGESCSQYKVKNGDRIEWLYTCDSGRDL